MTKYEEKTIKNVLKQLRSEEERMRELCESSEFVVDRVAYRSIESGIRFATDAIEQTLKNMEKIYGPEKTSRDRKSNKRGARR